MIVNGNESLVFQIPSEKVLGPKKQLQIHSRKVLGAVGNDDY
jgi:hypothetical protein